MKKLIIIFAAAVCALCACQKHEIELLDKPIIEQIDANTYTYTFSAVISDNVSEVEEDGTKATVSRAGAFAWAVDDELKFFKSDNSSANAKITAIDGSTATITVYDVDSRADFVTAIYPASAAVSKNQISFNARGPIVVADIADGGTLTFHHIGSLINLKFYDISGLTSIKSLVFEPASAFNYDGSFTFDGSHVPSLTLSGTTSKIVVPASNSDNNSDITVVVPSVNLSGFSAALNDKTDGTGRNLFKKSTATAHDLATNSPVLMNMKRVAYAAPNMYYISTESSRVGNTTNIPLIQTSSGPDIYEVAMNSDNAVSYSVFDSYNINNEGGAILTGTTNAFASVSSSDWKVVGQVNGNGWTINENLVDMQYLGNWHFVRNVLFDATSPEFKFFENPSDWSANSFKGDGTSIAVGSEGDIINAAGDPNIKLSSVSTEVNYDIFVNFVTRKVLVKLSSDKYFPEADGFFVFTYNKTSGTLSSSWQKALIDYPFDVNDPDMRTKMNIIGDFTSWEDKSMTYNNNHGWTTSIDIASDGTYKFDFRETGTWGWYRWSDARTATSMFGYSGWQSPNDNSCTINLTSGTYDVFVNAYSYYDNKAIKYSFVKR